MSEREPISKAAITRIARKAGVKRISGTVYGEVRNLVNAKLNELIIVSQTLTLHARRRTINEEDVLGAIEHVLHRKQYGDPPSKPCKIYRSKKQPKTSEGVKRPHRFRSGTKALAEIRFYQKNADDCLLIPQAPFSRLIRKFSLNYHDDIKVSKNAKLQLQAAIENFILELFENAQLAAIHAKRQKVYDSDLLLVLRIQRNS